MRPRCFLSPRADSGGYEVMTILANTFYLYEDYNHILYLFWIVCFSQEKRELWNIKELLNFWKKTFVCFFLCAAPRHTYSGFPQKLEHGDSKDVEWSSQVPDTAIRGKGFTHAVQSVPAWPTSYSQRGSPQEQRGMPGCMCSDCQWPAQCVQTDTWSLWLFQGCKSPQSYYY